MQSRTARHLAPNHNSVEQYVDLCQILKSGVNINTIPQLFTSKRVSPERKASCYSPDLLLFANT